MTAIVPFVLGLATGLGVCLLYRWQWLDRFRRFQGKRFTAGLSWHKLWRLENYLLNALFQQEQEWQRAVLELRDYCYLIEQLPLAYLEVDTDNYLLWCNSTMVKVLRVPMPDWKKPRLLLEWIRSYDLDQLIEETRSIASPQVREWRVNAVNRDPANPVMQRPLYLKAHAFPLAGGKVGVFLEDRYEFVTLSQQQNRWVSDVAHELKTPLTSIRLVAETLLSRVDPALRSWVDRLLKEVIHLSSLVQDLLDLGQLDRALFPQSDPQAVAATLLNLEPTDLVELVYAAWETLVPLNRHKQAHLLYLGPDRLILKGDGSRLYRVLLNLLDNAIKYSPPDRDIEVSINPVSLLENPDDQSSAPEVDRFFPDPEGQWVLVDVIDQGIGFTSQSLPHVFERFYRADEARSRETPPSSSLTGLPYASSSCGLGLAIVKQIVLAHGGIVEAKNHPRTGGAWIQILLPLNLEKSDQC